MDIIYFLPALRLHVLDGDIVSLALALHVGPDGLGSKRVGAKDIGRSGGLGLGGSGKEVAERESLVLGIPSLSIGGPRHILIGAGSNSACSCQFLDEVIYYFLVLYVCSTTFEKQPP